MRIQIFDAEGNFSRSGTKIGYPYGLFLAPDQHIWMADGGLDRIVELDENGTILGAIANQAPRRVNFAGTHFLAVARIENSTSRTCWKLALSSLRFPSPERKNVPYVPTKRMFYAFRPKHRLHDPRRSADREVSRGAILPAPVRSDCVQSRDGRKGRSKTAPLRLVSFLE